MIPRYSLPEFSELWSTRTKYETWLEVELTACQVMENFSIIPDGVTGKIRSHKVVFYPERLEAIEAEVRHDVIAFLTYIEECVGIDARWLHYGMTSSDLVDTATAVTLGKINDLLHLKFMELFDVFRNRIGEHRHTVMIGRSHGMHAEPITFGLMLAGHFAEFKRAYCRFLAASDEMGVGKLSGVVGTHVHISPEIELHVMNQLNLRPEDVSTQIVSRDRYANYFSSLALVATAIERLATNLRHLQRSEVSEVREEFTASQKGSSAMPHKHNPVLCENLCGLARMMRSMVTPAFEDVVLWHERDISHSSVERFILPDGTSLLGYMLNKTTQLLKYLFVDTKQMEHNVMEQHDLCCSESVLLALIRTGMSRTKAYNVVQKAIAQVTPDRSFFVIVSELLAGESFAIRNEELIKCFDLKYALHNIDPIIDKLIKP